jgi:hypothetical protein
LCSVVSYDSGLGHPDLSDITDALIKNQIIKTIYDNPEDFIDPLAFEGGQVDRSIIKHSSTARLASHSEWGRIIDIDHYKQYDVVSTKVGGQSLLAGYCPPCVYTYVL